MDNDKLTINDLYKLLICGVVLFFIFSPQIDLSFLGFIVNFISPNLTNYPYLNPPIFLSIGEAIASIAILLAVYQFRKEKWLVALRVRSYIEPVVFITISLGVILSISSSFVLFSDPKNILQLSIFWQVVASILIIFSLTFLFFKSSNKKLFNKRTARRFYEVLVSELSRPSPERLDVILNAILVNFDDICKFASQNDRSITTQSAINILDVVLGESSLVDLVSTKRLDALNYIIVIIEKYDLDERQVRGLPRIVRNLFIDQNSFLYKHLEKNGLALSSNLYTLLFGSPKILSNFNLFGWPTLDYKMQKNLNNIQIEVFIESLSQSIEVYLKTDQVPPRHINDGLSHLSEIFQDLCMKISSEEDRGVDTKHLLSDQWWSLHTIAHFLGHDYIFLAYQDVLDKNVTEREKTASEAGFFSNSTINEGIAAILYKSFEHLSYIKNTDDTYHTVLELLHGMIYEDQYKEGYRNPFEKRMWEQIAGNILKKHYPASLRTYLTFIGFSLASREVGERKGWIGEQTERMRRLLYIDLKPLLDKGEKMVNDEKMEDALLPSGMKYNNGKFYYTMGFGRGSTVEIMEPSIGSTSALDGIDLESRSLL